MIKVYHHHFKQAPSVQHMKELAAVLPLKFHSNIFKFLKDEDKYKALVGKLMLRSLLEEHDFGTEKLQQLQTDYYGKPTIPDVPAFNISHTHGMIVCAWAGDYEDILGIDVEYHQAIEIELFKSCFNEQEWQNINTAREPLDAFYRYWTMKESFIKADGRGLSLEPINVITDGMTAWEKGRSEIWHFYKLNIHPNYKVHLCLESATNNYTCMPFSI